MKNNKLQNLIQNAADTSTKKKFTYTLDPNVVEEFHKLCDKHKIKQSRLVEELMKDFIQLYRKSK